MEGRIFGGPSREQWQNVRRGATDAQNFVNTTVREQMSSDPQSWSMIQQHLERARDEHTAAGSRFGPFDSREAAMTSILERAAELAAQAAENPLIDGSYHQRAADGLRRALHLGRVPSVRR